MIKGCPQTHLEYFWYHSEISRALILEASSSFMEGFRCFLNAQLKTLISTGLNILGLKFKLDERELFIAINAITVVQNQ